MKYDNIVEIDYLYGLRYSYKYLVIWKYINFRSLQKEAFTARFIDILAKDLIYQIEVYKMCKWWCAVLL